MQLIPKRSTSPFLLAGFLSFLLSVWLYFVADEQTAGIFVGLWVPSIFSLGILLHLPVRPPINAPADSRQTMSTTVLFAAGATVTFITVWGILMSLGLAAMRHQPLDDAIVAPDHAPEPFTGPILVNGTSPVGDIVPPPANA